jgi:hypothetical protein
VATDDTVKKDSNSYKQLVKEAQAILAERAIDFVSATQELGGSSKLGINLNAFFATGTTFQPNSRLSYYSIDSSGQIQTLTYDPIKGGGARFYDLDGDDQPDFVHLSLIDGGYGDKDGVANRKIDDPSTPASVQLNPTLTAVSSRTITAQDPANSTAPASLILKASLKTRSSTANQIGYVVLQPDELTYADSLLADIDAIRSRARTLYTSLEDSDIVIPSGIDFSREFLLINGQSLRFFEVKDASLEQLSGSRDPRLNFFSHKHPSASTQALKLTSPDGIELTLELLSTQQGINALIAQEQALAPVLDLTGFKGNQQLVGTLVMGREADLDSVIGFYRVADIQGRVLDQSGNLVRPGDLRYKDAALLSQNRVDALTGLTVADNKTATRAVALSETGYLAPFMQVQSNTFFAFAAANTDGYAHFKMLGTNLFGAEDLLGGGDQDHDDLVFGFSFNQVAA